MRMSMVRDNLNESRHQRQANGCRNATKHVD
jgi:hypothetical protein